LAAYAFTVRRLAWALIDAHVNRGCTVRVIIDNSRSSAQAKMIVRLLQDAGVPTKQDKVPWYNDDGSYVYEIDKEGNTLLEENGSPTIKYGRQSELKGTQFEDPYTSRGYKGGTIHHNKYIIEYREDGAGAVFTGSFNFSMNAQTNFENILIANDWWAVQDFQNNFDENWNDDDPEDGHFDFIPVEYLYDAATNSTTPELAPVVTYRGEHDPYDESEWESQN
jgi:phosphatidylserine/phosphatidylglycerophosphate/cardiolipin synthase-like enzyme